MAIQAVLRYPGAKWKAWTQIEPLIPDDIEDWREPFFGGGSVSLLMAENPRFNLKRMLVGDLAPEIWAFWVGARDYPNEVMEIVRAWFSERVPTHGILGITSPTAPGYTEIESKLEAESRDFWKWSQEVDCTKLSIPERAARTFLVNRISFSGLGDSGSVSMDRVKDFRVDQVERVGQASPLLKKMEVINASFEETMANVDPEKSFVFLDPPYYTQEGAGLYGRKGDTHHGFPHDRLCKLLHEIKCRWLMTYDDSVAVRRMYNDMYLKPFLIKYTMAIVASEDALAGEELFVSNYELDREDEEEELRNLL